MPGKRTTYVSDESGPNEVYVRPFPNVSGGRIQVSNAGGVQPWWSRSGSELFYFAPTGELMRVAVASGPTWSAGRPTILLDRGYFYSSSGTAGSTFDLSADDRRFLMIRGADYDGFESDHIVVVQHWLDAMKRLANVTS